jgi:hypothetical protein
MSIVSEVNDGVKCEEFAEVIKIDEKRFGSTWRKLCGNRSRRRSTASWRLKPTSFAERSVTNEVLNGSIRVPVTMSGSSIPPPRVRRLHMTITTLCHRLQCLGWKPLHEARQSDGSWCVLATSCGHVILVLADSRQKAWSVACSMAMTFTREGFRGDHV